MATLTSSENPLQQGPHDEMGFLWENQSWDPSNSDDPSGERKDKSLEMKPPSPKDEGDSNEGEGEGEARATTSKERGKNVKKGKRIGKLGESDHELHIWTERERRKKMRNMFASLHALLPQLPSKADKSTIVDEAVSYIKNLEQTLENLEKEKQERLQNVSAFGCESSVINSQWHPYDSSRETFNAADNGSSSNSNNDNAFSVPRQQQPVAFQTWSSPNVVLNICGDGAQFCIFSTRKSGLLTTIAFVLEKHKIEVISANVSYNGNNGNTYMIMTHAKRALLQLPDANSLQETYKQAAGEIMLWIA